MGDIMIGYVTWSVDEKRYLLKTADGQVAVKSKNLGYIERVVRCGWDQATRFGITELQVEGQAPEAQPVPKIEPSDLEPLAGAFSPLVNVNQLLGQLTIQPQGKRGRGRPRRPKSIKGVTLHREADMPSKYVTVTPKQHEMLKREYLGLAGGIRERVEQLAERHGMSYRQVHELVEVVT